MDDAEIGEAIRKLRRARGWTQDQLAGATGLDISTISKIERGEGGRTSTYQKILEALGARLVQDIVFDGSPDGDTLASDELRAALRSPIDPNKLGSAFQQRLVQIALDVDSLERAQRIATLAIGAGADLLEIGDPLIKRFGMEAARRIRMDHPTMPIVVELSSSDWADEQVALAADAGADIVMLLGLRSAVRIERAVSAARLAGVGIIVGLPPDQEIASWCRAAQSHSVDAIAVIRNIDTASTVADSLRQVKAVRRVVQTPIAVSGGFTPSLVLDAISHPWNVVIVGRTVVQAADPAAVVRNIVRTVHGH